MGKYDITGALTPVKSTFVDPGVATFKEAAQIYRANYDKNKDAYNLTKRVINQMQLMPGDENAGLREQFANVIDQKFDQIVQSGAFEDADMAVQNAVDYIISDNLVTEAQRNAAEWIKEEALIDQFGPSGILDFNVGPDGRPIRETFTTQGVDEQGQPTINKYREHMEMKEGYAAFMNDLVAGIAKDGSPWMSDKYGVSAGQVSQYLTYGTTKGVSKSKMERIVNDLYETYVGDKVGDQDLRRLTEIEGLSPEMAKQDIIRRMTGLAGKQVGKEVTISGMKDLGGGSASKNQTALTIDNWTQAILTKGPQRIGYQSYLAMTEGSEGAVPNSVAVSGQKGITLDFATQIPAATINAIKEKLIEGNIAADANVAESMIEPLLHYLAASEAGDIDAAKAYAEIIGFDYDTQSEELNLISQRLKTVIDQSALDNMGALLNVEVNGSFRPDQQSTYNAEMIGGALIVDGRYFFNKSQMNTMADKMNAGHVGAWFWGIFDTDDIESMEDASGNKMWTYEGEINGEEYWSIKGKSAPVPYTQQTGDKWFLETHSEGDFNDWQVPINQARQMAHDMNEKNILTVTKITSDLASLSIPQDLKKEIQDLSKAYLNILLKNMGQSATATGGVVDNYKNIADGLRSTVATAAATPGTSRQFIQQEIDKYLISIFGTR